MEKPKMYYRITISNKGKNYKFFDTEEEAVNYLHNWVEADGNHVFVETLEGRYGLPVLKWLEWGDDKPRFITKSVSLGNPEEWKAYWEWEAQQKVMEKARENRKRLLEAYNKAVKDYTESQKTTTIYGFKWKE